MLDHDDGVAGVGQAAQQAEQSIDIGGMQADRRLVEFVEGVDEMRAERIRKRDALRFAPREGARQPVEREIAETDVVDEAHACAQLAQDMVRHGLLERGEGQLLEPGGEIGGRQRRRVGDRLARHADRE